MFLVNDAEAFHKQMDTKCPFLVTLMRIDILDTFYFDFHKLFPRSENRCCADIVYSQFLQVLTKKECTSHSVGKSMLGEMKKLRKLHSWVDPELDFVGGPYSRTGL